MKIWFILLTGLLFLNSCNESKDASSEETPETMLNSIQEMDDSLHLLVDRKMRVDSFKIDKLVYHEAINRNKEFVKTFPKHEKVEQSLEKIASMYLQIGVESEAAKWRDSILMNFPENRNKIALLEMQMNYYDNENYDRQKIEYYANQLLAIKNLPEGKKEDYEFRLKHIDKTFDELIMIRMKENDSLNNTVKTENI